MNNNKTTIKVKGKYAENINDFAKRIISYTKRGYIVETEFNGVKFTTENLETEEDIIKTIYDGYERAGEEYRNSLEYKIEQTKIRLQKLRSQRRVNNFMKAVENLDFNNVFEVVKWLDDIRKELEYHPVIPFDEIVTILENNGFVHFDEFLKNNRRENENISAVDYVSIVDSKIKAGKYVISRYIESIKEYRNLVNIVDYISESYIYKYSEEETTQKVK